jgi:hypothetical protein
MRDKRYDFYVGSKKSKKYAGHFIVDEKSKKINIELFDFSISMASFPIIYAIGETEELTLLNSTIIKTSFGFKNLTATLKPTYVLIGNNAIPKSKLKFTKLTTNLTNLNSWFFPGDFSNRLENYKNLYDPHYSEDLLSGDIEGGVKYTIRLSNYHFGNPTSYEIHNSIKLILSFSKAVEVGEALNILTNFIRFFTILLFAEIDFDYLRLENLSHRGKQYRGLKAYDLQVNSDTSFQTKNREQLQDYSFEFADIRFNFNKFLNTFLSKNKLISSTFNHLIECIINEPTVALEYKFQGTCFAIETFHRALYEQPVMDKTLFREQKKLALSSVSNPEFKKLLQESLAHVNSTKFKDRIRFCFSRIPSSIQSKIPDYKYFEKFVKLIGDTRNKQVHNANSQGESFLDSLYLNYYLFYKLRFILYINILLELGVGTTEIEDFYADFSFITFLHLIQNDYFVKMY